MSGGRPVVVTNALAEVTKPWFGDPVDHERATRRYVRGQQLAGWEPLEVARARFGTGVGQMGSVEPLVIVTHGTVMTAWLDSVLGLGRSRSVLVTAASARCVCSRHHRAHRSAVVARERSAPS